MIDCVKTEPEIMWEESEVNIPEGGDREVCFTSDIGTAVPYQVRVGARNKGANPATRGMPHPGSDKQVLTTV